MLFNSLEYIFFFPMVIAGYFALNPKYRWILLLFASYYFYMCWNYKYIVLILFSTIIDYFSALYMARTPQIKKRRLLLYLSLFSNLGLLFFFKYFNFFAESVNAVFDQFNLMRDVRYFDLLLPVGISFYTFQTLSYTIDVFRGKKEPERHFGKFALYVSFFPQLVAGPIERSTRLLPQLHKHFDFDYQRIKEGVFLVAWGYFKKVVIADRLAEYVNLVYNNPTDFSGLQTLMGTFFFSFQIYCDFSGYSDIAIGFARIMGYDLMTNFRRPYFAQNIKDFWRRWHISLSSWFRDYFYILLGGNRVGKTRHKINVFLTFVVSGLWHGANWTFVIWGALHGFYQIVEMWKKSLLQKHQGLQKIRLPNIYRQTTNGLVTFTLVYLAWIFFRANNVGDAFYILQNAFVFNDEPVNLFQFKADMTISWIAIAFLLITEILEETIGLYNKLARLPRVVKWSMFVLLLLSIMVLGKWNESDFLYFQF